MATNNDANNGRQYLTYTFLALLHPSRQLHASQAVSMPPLCPLHLCVEALLAHSSLAHTRPLYRCSYVSAYCAWQRACPWSSARR